MNIQKSHWEEIEDTLNFMKTASYGTLHPVSTALIDAGDLIERLAQLLEQAQVRIEELEKMK